MSLPVWAKADGRRAIFEEFEPPSDDEDEDDEDEDEDGALARKTQELDVDDEEGGTGVLTSQLRHFVIQVGSRLVSN